MSETCINEEILILRIISQYEATKFPYLLSTIRLDCKIWVLVVSYLLITKLCFCGLFYFLVDEGDSAMLRRITEDIGKHKLSGL